MVNNVTKRRRMLTKEHKRLERQKASLTQRIIAIVFAIIFIGFFIALAFINSYIQKRYLIQNNSEVLIFVITSVTFASMPSAFLGGFISLGYFSYYQFEKFDLKKSWKGLCVFLTVSIFLAIIPFIFIKNRYDITQDGIYKYSNSGLIQRRYSLSDISEVRVKIFPPGYKSSYSFNYIIKFKTGKTLYLVSDGYSKNFWNNLYLIDDIIRKQNIKVYRDSRYLGEFSKEYVDKISPLLK